LLSFGVLRLRLSESDDRLLHTQLNGGTLRRMKSILLVAILGFPTLLQTSAWKKADKSDALLKISFVEYSLNGTFLTRPHHSSLDAPRLVLHCQPSNHKARFLEGWIDVGAVVKIHVGPDGSVVVPLSFRLDDKKLESDYWPSSTDGTSIFLNVPGCATCYVNKLLFGRDTPHKRRLEKQTHKVLVGVQEAFGSEIEMQFDIPDVAEVGDACGLVSK